MRIIATIGPSSNNKIVISKLINNGVDTLRLNCSHFHEEEFTRIINDSRKIYKNIEIMADLCGKKVRVYEKVNSVYKVYENEIVYFCSEDVYKIIINRKDDIKVIPLNISSKFIEENDIKNISMKDGTMNFKILEKDKVFLKARVCNTGVIRGGKGCNIPEVNLGKNNLSEKDKKNIIWALNNNIEIICQSFVESSEEIIDIKDYISSVRGNINKIKIFAKIETKEGLKNCNEILRESDGVIIARGDLVPECGLILSVKEEFNLLYRIKKSGYKKEVIIATHILDSMRNGSLANINEVESIYTFINIGVNGFLLAGETSIGKYPERIVEFLEEIIKVYSKV